jgi:predicted cytidylate kinase
MHITISGDIGAGKSTVAKMVAKQLGRRLVATGELFRSIAKNRGLDVMSLTRECESDAEIDRAIDEEVSRLAKTQSNLVFDSRLAHTRIKDAISFYLSCPEDVAARRIAAAKREDERATDETHALRMIRARREAERTRWMNVYGTDIEDKSAYDFVIDATRTPDKVAQDIIKKAVDTDNNGTWENLGDVNYGIYGGHLARRDPDQQDTIEVFALDAPEDDDFFRARLYSIDLADIDTDKMRHLFAVNGLISDASADAVVCADVTDETGTVIVPANETADDGVMRKIAETIGPLSLASMFVSYHGDNWEIPTTFHDYDDGWNGPWREAQDSELKPYAQLEPSELVEWLRSLGAKTIADEVEQQLSETE